MTTTKIKQNGEWIIIDWDNIGKIGVDLNGKVWKNINNPTLVIKPTLIPNDKTFLKPLFDHIDNLIKVNNLYAKKKI